MEAISAAYPTTYQDSMNTVLVQEAIRYNALTAAITSSLRDTLRALEGVVVMSPDLEQVVNSLYDNRVRRAGRGRGDGRLSPVWLRSCAHPVCRACLLRPRAGARRVGGARVPLPQAAARLGGRPAGAPDVHRELGRQRAAARLLDQRLLLPSGVCAWVCAQSHVARARLAQLSQPRGLIRTPAAHLSSVHTRMRRPS
jgi:hypothetical protein